MKKLALEIESLRVDSFSTSLKEGVLNGTVRGFDGSSAHELCRPGDTRSVYWSCVCSPSGMYTCAC
jgi:hypothetical protein